MSDLPEGWTSPRLEEIALINPRHTKSLSRSLIVSFIPMPRLSEATWRLDLSEQRNLGEVIKGYTHFADGDVLFAKITPCMENGKAAVANRLVNGLGCGTTELHVLRPLGGVDPTYLYYFLHQENFRKEAARNFTGSAGQLRVPVSFIKGSSIPLAPTNEQHRIVAKLEELLSKVDVCRKRLAKIPTILKRFRQAVLAAAYSGRLTAEWRCRERESESPSSSDQRTDDQQRRLNNGSYGQADPFDVGDLPALPDEWHWVRLGDLVVDSFYGPRFAKEDYRSNGVLTIRTTDMDDRGRIILNDPPRIPLTPEKLAFLGLKHEDLLITRTGATIGKCAIYDEALGPALPSAYVIRFRLDREKVVVKYLLLYLLSSEGQKLLSQGTTAVAQPNVNAKTIGRFSIPLPPFCEQNEIVRRVEALFKFADQIEIRYRKAKAEVDELAESVLAKAFRGDLVPTEAELARREGRDYNSLPLEPRRIVRE